jgi:hypothetical protein
MEEGEEIKRMKTVLGKDLYEDYHTISIRIPTENLVHGDKLHLSVELLERDVDALSHASKGESKEVNESDE